MKTIQDIRSQYPQYSDMSDSQLADALHAKYYSDMDKTEFYGKVGLPTATESAPAAVEPEPSFLGGVDDALSKRAGNIANEWSGASRLRQLQQGEQNDVLENFPLIPGRVLRTAGQMAGGINDIVGEGIKAGYRNLVPQEAQDAIGRAVESVLQSRPARAAMPIMQAIQERYGQAKEAYPEMMGNVEAVGNISTILPMGWAAGRTKAALTPVANIPKIEQKIDQAITNGIKKGIRPSVVGKSDAGLVQKYYDNAKTAVRDIVETSPTPLSKSENIVEDFSKAVADTKKKIWGEAHNLATAAGESGVKVDILPVLNDMKVVKTDLLLQAQDPRISSVLDPYIAAWENLIKSKGQYMSPIEAEDMIAGLNAQAKPFWKDPNTHTSAAQIERIAQNMRKQTFDAMEGAGEQYANLRKRYGAQLALEKEVTDRATVAGRRGAFGFFDLANIPIAKDFVGGLLTGNIKQVAQAGAMGAAKLAMKMSNDPAHILRKMFKDVETLTAIKKRYGSPSITP
jgi:hypothetical protein